MAISFYPSFDWNASSYARTYMPNRVAGDQQVPGMKMPPTDSVVFGKATNDPLGRTEEKGECQTCKNRKYVDGSDEGNVSFKAPGHISPEASAGMVMAHEQEHVANAVREGNKAGNELLSVSVSLKTAVCPECGRTFVAGGTTRTVIRYGNTPYEQNRKSADYARFVGANIDRKS